MSFFDGLQNTDASNLSQQIMAALMAIKGSQPTQQGPTANSTSQFSPSYAPIPEPGRVGKFLPPIPGLQIPAIAQTPGMVMPAPFSPAVPHFGQQARSSGNSLQSALAALMASANPFGGSSS